MKYIAIRCLIFFLGFFLLPGLISQESGFQHDSDERMAVPEGFLWGTAVSEFQVSGEVHCPRSQWANWDSLGGDRSGSGADHWNLYRDDIEKMKELGVNAFRFSIEWSLVEPEEGILNQEAIEHYREVLEALKANGITPVVTLYHFTHPQWFEDIGAFEKRENIAYFVRFCSAIFQEFHEDINIWCTINEPTVLVLMGYILGEFPPGKKDRQLAGRVYENLLLAHTKVYDELKALPGGGKAQIGLIHAYLKIEPYHRWNPIEAIPSHYMTKNLHEAMMQFLRTGLFQYHFPFQEKISIEIVEEEKIFYDFIGLNYYSRAVISMQFSLSQPLVGTCFEGEVMTDMPYGVYPKGFYEALMDCNTLGKPVYVTENGIADAKDDRRSDFIQKYLSAMNQAIRDGADVRGYFYWSLIDNFEWAEGWKMRFGLYEFDPITKERTLKEGAKTYQRLIEESQVVPV